MQRKGPWIKGFMRTHANAKRGALARSPLDFALPLCIAAFATALHFAVRGLSLSEKTARCTCCS